MFQNRLKGGFQHGHAHVVEGTFEDRVLQSYPEAFQCARHASQPFGMADVVADQVASAAHCVRNGKWQMADGKRLEALSLAIFYSSGSLRAALTSRD